MMAPNVFRVWSHLSLFSEILEVNPVLLIGNLCNWTFHVRVKKVPYSDFAHSLKETSVLAVLHASLHYRQWTIFSCEIL